MENILIVLPKSKKEIFVSVDRKEMKTCRLKVYPDQAVIIAVPKSVSTEWINSFLVQKSEWIEKNSPYFPPLKAMPRPVKYGTAFR